MEKVMALWFVLSLTLFTIGEAEAGKSCQCKYRPTAWAGNNRCFLDTGGAYKPCLGGNMTCAEWGKRMGQMAAARQLRLSPVARQPRPSLVARQPRLSPMEPRNEHRNELMNGHRNEHRETGENEVICQPNLPSDFDLECTQIGTCSD